MSGDSLSSNPLPGRPDPWESVLALEETAFEEGARQAREDARERYPEGRRTGFSRGFEVGFEAGFIEVAVEAEDQLLSDREARRRQRIREGLKRLPRENDPELDFSSAMSEVRSLYAACSSSVGAVLKSRPRSTDW